jgi:hypothetical protein
MGNLLQSLTSEELDELKQRIHINSIPKQQIHMSQTFFMVLLENERTPTYKHSNIVSAEKEAKRLAEVHNRKAYVLCAIKSFEKVQFNIEDLRPNNSDLPF